MYQNEPKSSEMMSMKNYSKSKPGNSTVPISPTEFEAAGPGFIPPPVPQDRVPRGPLFAEDPRSPIMSWPLPFPPPPPAINLAVPPGYFTARDFSGPPFLPPPRDFPGLPFAPYPDEPESLEMTSTKNNRKSDPGKSTVPNSLPAEFEAASTDFIPPPIPQDRDPRGPLFAGDPRSPVMSRPPPFPPPTPGNIHPVPPCYFISRDFAGPPFLPYPGRNVNEPRGFLPFLPARAGFVPLPLHPESRNELPPDFIMSSKQPAPELLETQET
ncbi:putative cutaneous T-cell lymphoma-associated antigen 5 like protein [Cricetulus griseus]|nr:putative cutaneous T-cell lymphoma-associated antigen 5 like protein [Cricetulus griseus]